MEVSGRLLVLAIHFPGKYPSLDGPLGRLGTKEVNTTIFRCQQSNPCRVDHISNNLVQFRSFIKVFDNSEKAVTGKH
jgi:hypothetical protein